MHSTPESQATPSNSSRPSQGVRTVAVIDVGTASIRMAIADITPDGDVRTLENLSQSVGLGKDTFTLGMIRKSTIESCVEVLKSYRQVLQEYQVNLNDDVRVVATSAVREANNRLAFVDRIFSATGFEIEPIDEAEVNRVTYLGIQPILQSDPKLSEKLSLIVEVGGGSTEVILVQGNDVVSAHTYRLGSLRLRETLKAYRAPTGQTRQIMDTQILRTVEEIHQHVPEDNEVQLLAMGGDIRFAARQFRDYDDDAPVNTIRTRELEKFIAKIIEMTDDELVQQYHLSYPDAETVRLALLSYWHIARTFALDQILVTNVNLRDGLLEEKAAQDAWTDEFRNQIVRAALDLGRKYDVDEDHAHHVAEIGQKLFHALQEEHQLDSRYELLLHLAALLHEVGQFIRFNGQHKHTMYIINNSELFGLTRHDLLIVALVARYHRRASPKPSHQGYVTLGREERIAVSKLAAMLRVADALERSRSQRIQDLTCHREKDQLVIAIPNAGDLSLEQLALKQKGPLFEEVFGLKVLLRPQK